MRTLSPTLDTEMDSLFRHPAGRLTIERWLPSWTNKISGLSAGKAEQYAHGHATAVAVNGNGMGEDILFRARSGSSANPQDGKLYIAVIKGADMDDPAQWDTLWIDTGLTGLMFPAWTANSGAAHGGSIAAVWDHGRNVFRVFYCAAVGGIHYAEFDYSGAGGYAGTVTSFTPDVYYYASCQIASCNPTELFILRTELVEAGLAAWHQPIYGTNIIRYSYSGSWQPEASFIYHTHAEGGLYRDGPLEGADFSDASCADTVQQWGKRPCGGLAANEIDSNTVVVSFGMVYWRKWAYDTHSQGLQSFIYHRDSGWWERGPQAGFADYNTGQHLTFDGMARGCEVEGKQIIVWSRLWEPGDFEQVNNSEFFPRVREVVYSILDETGKNLTQFVYLGEQDDFTAATIAVINHAGGKNLYAIGWRSVAESPPASFLCAVDSPQDMELHSNEFKTRRGNQWDMSVEAPLLDSSILFEDGTPVESGALIRAYLGTESEMVQVGQGFLDINTPSLSLQGRSHKAKIVGRADKPLQDTRAEDIEDILPQNTMYIPPTDPIKHVSRHRGYWEIATGAWDNTFFGGIYGMGEVPVRRLLSFPYAYTGGAEGYGDPGDILNERPSYKGSWFQDVNWLAMEPMVDGSLEASVRFGDINNQGNFSFKALDGNTVTANIYRINGMIRNIIWNPGAWNNVYQEACMAGLLFHAPDIGKKYAFVWEADSNFIVSSHTDDTWKNEDFDSADYTTHGVGENRLYLIVSDFDEDDPDWQANDKWINKSVVGNIVATGLTPGRPADLKIQVLGGTVYCFYRATATNGAAPNQWKFAFSHKSARFGAGKFGVVGRGHAGIQWDVLRPGKNYITRCDNYVDFWNIKLSDNVMDQPLEDVLRRYAWRGYVDTEFRSVVDDAGQTVNAGTHYDYSMPVTNLCIDFKITIPASNYEAGIYLRGIDINNPTHDCIRLGLVAHASTNSASSDVYYYVVKRRYASNAEVVSAREYSPIPVPLRPGVPVPVRITARGAIYSVWIAGNYAGHFKDNTELGLYFGLYAVHGNTNFSNIHVPELYEVPEFALLDVNQTMLNALRKAIGKRRIKGVFTWDGKLKFSMFNEHDSGPSFEDTLKQSTLRRSDRFYSKVTVEGALTRATYASKTLLKKGERFHVEHLPDIFHHEFCYQQAKAIVIEVAETQEQGVFIGPSDLRVEPEDIIGVTVAQQDAAGSRLVNDVTFHFKLNKDKSINEMTLGTRQFVIL